MFMIIMSTSCVATTGLEVRLATSRLAIGEMSCRLRRAVGEMSHRQDEP